jgi:hypothetical protein
MKFFQFILITIFTLGIIVNLFPADLANIMGDFGIYVQNLTIFSIATIPITDLYMDTNLGLGRIAIHHPNTFIETKAAESEIFFGKALQYVSDPDRVKTVDGSSGRFAGVSGHSINASGLTANKYSVNDSVGVIRSGFVTVYCEEAVSPGDAVRVRHTNHSSNATKIAGNFAKTADPGKTYILEGAKWEKSITESGEAILFLSDTVKIIPDAAV